MTQQEYFLQVAAMIAAAVHPKAFDDSNANMSDFVNTYAAEQAGNLLEEVKLEWETRTTYANKYGALFDPPAPKTDDEYTATITFEDGSSQSVEIEANDTESANKFACSIFEHSKDYGAKVWHCYHNNKLIGFGTQYTGKQTEN